MLSGRRDAPIAVQGQIRLVICSGPFAHNVLYPSRFLCVFYEIIRDPSRIVIIILSGVKGKSNVYFCGMVEDIFVFEEDADL